jgi:hypothetical protein
MRLLTFYLILGCVIWSCAPAQPAIHWTDDGKLTPEAMKADFQEMLQSIEGLLPYPDYIMPPKKRLLYIQSIEEKLQEPLSRGQFLQLMQQFVAGLGDAHFSIRDTLDYSQQGDRFFPYPVLISEDQLWVKANESGNWIPVKEINGVSTRQWLLPFNLNYPGRKEWMKEPLFPILRLSQV